MWCFQSTPNVSHHQRLRSQDRWKWGWFANPVILQSRKGFSFSASISLTNLAWVYKAHLAFLSLQSYENLTSSISLRTANCKTSLYPPLPNPTWPTIQHHPTAPPAGQRGASLIPHLYSLFPYPSVGIHSFIHSLIQSFIPPTTFYWLAMMHRAL